MTYKKHFIKYDYIGNIKIPKKYKNVNYCSIIEIISKLLLTTNISIKYKYLPYILYILQKNSIRNSGKILFNIKFILKDGKLIVNELQRNVFINNYNYIDENDSIKLNVNNIKLHYCNNYDFNYIETILSTNIKDFTLDDYILSFQNNSEIKQLISCNYNGIIDSDLFLDYINYIDKKCESCGCILLTNSDYVLCKKLYNRTKYVNIFLNIFKFISPKYYYRIIKKGFD